MRFKSSQLIAIVLLGLSVSLCTGTAGRALATPSAQSLLNEDGAASAKGYAHAVRALNAYSITSGSLTDALGGGVSYNIDALILGRFSANGRDMLILQCGETSIDAEIPHDFAPDWLSNQSMVHFIVRDAPERPTLTDAADVQGASTAEGTVCTILAAAPDNELAELQVETMPARSVQALTSRNGDYGEYTPQAGPAMSPRISAGAAHPSLSNLPAGHPIEPLTPSEAAVYPYYRADIRKINPGLDDATLDKITTSLLIYSNWKKIDPRLIMAMIIAESDFNPNSTSDKGAMGLGQLMPGTAAGLISDPYDPIENIGAAVEVLDHNIGMYGGKDQNGQVSLNTLLLSMAAYNAGNGAVQKYHGIPPYHETQRYVQKVALYYRKLCGD